MNKLNKELLDRALVEGVDESYDGKLLGLATANRLWTGFHIVDFIGKFSNWQYVCTKEEYLAAKAEKESRKTVMDGVNEFKGEVFTGAKSFVCNQKSGEIQVWCSDSFTYLVTPLWAPLCSLSEFKELVKECETNFGTSQSYEEYKKGYKTMSDTKSEYDIGCYYEFSDDSDFYCSAISKFREINVCLTYKYMTSGGVSHKYMRPLTAKAGEIRKPKPLSGFLNIDADGCNAIHKDKTGAMLYSNDNRIACIDLSQFNEGEGL